MACRATSAPMTGGAGVYLLRRRQADVSARD
jgi:hypothetical protein